MLLSHSLGTYGCVQNLAKKTNPVDFLPFSYKQLDISEGYFVYLFLVSVYMYQQNGI